MWYNKIAVQLFNQINNQSINELLLINDGWKTIQEAIIYAKHNNIIICEFIENNDLLKRFNCVLYNN